MREHDPISNDARQAERLRKFGPEPHLCLFCGLDDPSVLIPKTFRWLKQRVHRSILEKHHVLGRNHDNDFIVLLCRNCHAKVTEGYLQVGIELRREPNVRKRIAQMLRAEAAFLRQLAERNCQWAADLCNGATRTIQDTRNDT
jgi:hypothetical protein